MLTSQIKKRIASRECRRGEAEQTRLMRATKQIAKKLSVFTTDDISVILEISENELKLVLSNLVKNNLLKFDGKHYVYIEPIRSKPLRIRERSRSRKVCDINYENYEDDFVQKVIECFCANVESSKAALLLNSTLKTIICIYGDFRKKIYERQLKILEQKFEQSPKMPASREYLRTNVWLYCYSKQVFVTTEALQAEVEAKIHSKKEISQIKMINCLLRRRFEKSSNFSYVEHRAAEHIWRKGKKYSELVQELTKFVEEPFSFTNEKIFDRQYESFDDFIFYNAEENARKQALKLILVLSLTNGLEGNDLKACLNNWNKTADEAAVSYDELLIARDRFQKSGKLGLLQLLNGELGVKMMWNSMKVC